MQTYFDSIKQIWKKGFGLYQKMFFKVLAWTIFISIIGSAAQFVENKYLMVLKPDFLNNCIHAGVFLLTLSVSFYLSTVLFHRIYIHSEGVHSKFAQSLMVVLKKYPAILTAMLFSTLMTIVGVVLLVLPGVFLFVLLMFVQPLILFERKDGFSAIKSSALLVWGRWWRVLLGFLPALIMGGLIGLGVSQLVSFGVWVQFGASVLSMMILYPLTACFLLVQYHNLKKISVHDKK